MGRGQNGPDVWRRRVGDKLWGEPRKCQEGRAEPQLSCSGKSGAIARDCSRELDHLVGPQMFSRCSAGTESAQVNSFLLSPHAQHGPAGDGGDGLLTSPTTTGAKWGQSVTFGGAETRSPTNTPKRRTRERGGLICSIYSNKEVPCQHQQKKRQHRRETILSAERVLFF